jgi:putative membrane protein
MSDSKRSAQISSDAPTEVTAASNTDATKLVSPSAVVERSTMSRERSGMLIICIDRDNDVGLKTGIETPIVGRTACLEAATKLALADPEEADANTIFAAVKEYEELISKGINCEVITVGGLFERGVLGDKKIREEVESVLRDYPAAEAVVVSDGVEGEELTPVISPLVPVVSIRKVIIKHSESVEESYQVLGRYFKMLLTDPRYSKYALGLPGLVFIGITVAYLVSSRYAPLILVALIGIILAVRGFNVDREIGSIRTLSSSGFLRLFGIAISVLIIIGGIVSGIVPFFTKYTAAYNYVWGCNSSHVCSQATLTISSVPTVLGYFIEYAQVLTFVGMGVYVVGAIFFNLLRPTHRHVLRNVVALIVLGLLYYPVYLFAQVLISKSSPDELVGYALFSLAVSFVIAAFIYNWVSTRRGHPDIDEIEV